MKKKRIIRGIALAVGCVLTSIGVFVGVKKPPRSNFQKERIA